MFVEWNSNVPSLPSTCCITRCSWLVLEFWKQQLGLPSLLFGWVHQLQDATSCNVLLVRVSYHVDICFWNATLMQFWWKQNRIICMFNCVFWQIRSSCGHTWVSPVSCTMVLNARVRPWPVVRVQWQFHVAGWRQEYFHCTILFWFLAIVILQVAWV